MRRCLGLVLSVAVGASGCSFLQSRTETVAIMATDPEADILVNGQVVGRGAATVTRERHRAQQVMARTADHRSGVAQLRPTRSSAGIIDVVAGACLAVPLLGLLAPGSRTLGTASVVVPVPAAQR